jgi:hypothetical protein
MRAVVSVNKFTIQPDTGAYPAPMPSSLAKLRRLTGDGVIRAENDSRQKMTHEEQILFAMCSILLR